MTMDTKALLAEAEALKPQLLTDRRTLHRDPEVGPSLPRTAAYVTERLTALGYAPRPLAGGVVADITGEDTGRCVLLRADMDALRVREATGLDFQSENGAMHACGHDMHAAMLLSAAALLKRHQADLKGTVRLVFQPDEEGFTGAKSMLAAGVLKDAPTPKAALALHVNSGTPSGMVLCGRGTFMAGCTLFRVSVRGTGCHGAMPETGVDPINIAAHIYLSLQELTAREISAKKPAVVTVGRFQGGQAPNIIPEEAVLEGTIRTFDRELSARIMERIRVIAENTAAAFRGSAHLEEIASAPPLVNDPALMEQVAGWAEELAGKEKVYRLDQGGMGSEDFASFTYALPCAYLLLGAGTPQEDPRYGKPMHNEAVVFNEEALTRREPFYQYDAPGVTAYAGVDVSSYQGNVDWPAVKAAGADFAMLRVGFRGYGTGALVEDNAFAQNAADAANAGLTVGVYFYSQAVTEEEAAEEARFVVERLRGTNVSGPIAYDLEFYTADEARTDDLTGEQATQNALAFCDVIRQAGYEPVVYMNLHWAGSMYGMEALAHLPVWLASYGPVPALDRGVTLWQYSESGVVDGVEGPVDLDLWFTKE